MYGSNDWRDYLAHHGIRGQKWGVRNGPPYPLKDGVNSRSKQIHKQAKDKVTKIENDVTSAATKAKAKMYGLENKLKTSESIARKLQSDKEIKDAVRFTVLSPEKDYVNNYFSVKEELLNKGYSETRCKNYFLMYREGKVKHKAVQTNFKTNDGYEFEIQFHTPASQHAKDLKVPIYNEARNPNTTPKRKAELEQQMVQLAENVKDPVGIEKIKSH